MVRDLVLKNFKGSGRNITCDNFFTTFDLAKELMVNNLSILGTVNKKRKFIPQHMLPHKEREVCSPSFAHSEDVVMCSYVPKKNKAVILISSSHYAFEIQIDNKFKPSMIVDYNHTEGGTDTMDQMLGNRKTKRWTEALFYNCVDIAALAAFIIYKENNTKHVLIRRNFLNTLAIDLCNPEIERRSKVPVICGNFYTKSAIEAILGIPITDERAARDESTVQQSQYKKCYSCKKTTRTTCNLCHNGVCKTHSMKLITCEKCNFMNAMNVE